MTGMYSGLSGYMLGTDRVRLMPGQRWLPYDVLVYVCLNIDTAKDILETSHRTSSDTIDPVVWTTIYHVTAPLVRYERIDYDMLWTPDARKIIVDRPVLYKAPPQISESEILNKAKFLTPVYSKFIKSLRRTK